VRDQRNLARDVRRLHGWHDRAEREEVDFVASNPGALNQLSDTQAAELDG
jgi:hypothetical protein